MAVVIEQNGLEFARASLDLRATTLALSNGGFVVVWGDPSGLALKIFNATGELEFYAVGEAPPGSDWYQPTATLLQNGDLAVSWISDSGSSAGDTVQQVIDLGSLTPIDSANPNTPESLTLAPNIIGQADTGTDTFDDLYTNMALLSNGLFVTVWNEDAADGVVPSGQYNTVLQFSLADGTPIFSPVVLDRNYYSYSDFVNVTSLSNGNFVVTWADSDTNSYGVVTQVYQNTGAPVGAAVQVNSMDAYLDDFPETIALGGGKFATAWTSDTSDTDVYVRIFKADGTPSTGELLVHNASGDNQSLTGIAVLGDGGFVVGWSSCGCNGSTSAVRVFNSDGSVRTNEIAVPGNVFPAVAALPDGTFAVAWASTDSSSGDFLSVRVYDANGSLRYAGTQQISSSTSLDIVYSAFSTAPDLAVLGDGSLVVQVPIDANGADEYFSQIFHFSNEAPNASNATFTVLEDTPRKFAASDFGFSDIDGDSLSSVIINSLPLKGVLTLNGSAVAASQSITIGDINAGKLVWTPPANVNGMGLASFSFQVTDGGGTKYGGQNTSSSHSLTFNVTAVPDAPVLDYLGPTTTAENRKLVMDVLSGATDGDGDVLSVTAASLVSGFGKVTINKSGNIIYDPTKGPNQDIAEGESKTVTISYTVSDGNGGATTDQIEITVEGISPDIFKGTAKRDELVGTSSEDRIFGRANNDRLDGRGGDDILKGGKGADTFVFGHDYGRDTILDFKPGQDDRIDLSDAVGIRNFNDLMNHHIEDVGKNLVITADDGSVLVLRHVDLGDLSRDDFLF